MTDRQTDRPRNGKIDRKKYNTKTIANDNLAASFCSPSFYRAMHFSAIARYCDRMSSVCLSVRLSVTLVNCDHIGWNSSKIISPLVSLGCSFSTDPNMTGLRQGEHPEIWAQSDPPPVDFSVGDIRSQIAAEWLQIAQRSQWRAYRKPPSLVRIVPSLTPTTSPPPKWGSVCPQDTRMAISPQRVIRYTSCLVLGWGFWKRRIEWHYFRFEQIQAGGSRHVGKNFKWPYLRNRSSDQLHVWF